MAHAYAELFPMMSAEELEALTADIAANGLRCPIVLYEGNILDGRNRLLACEKAGVEPAFTEFEGDDEAALAAVISLNALRRELTAGQRAIVAARALDVVANSHGGDRKSSARTVHLKRDDVAKAFKVGVNSVQQAKALLSKAPDLARQVEARTLSLADAYGEWNEVREETSYGWRGERVELNAMSSAQFITFLERKLEEHGVRKVVPDRKRLEKAFRRATEIALLNRGIQELA